MSWEYFVINVYSLRFFQSQTKTLLKLVEIEITKKIMSCQS